MACQLGPIEARCAWLCGHRAPCAAGNHLRHIVCHPRAQPAGCRRVTQASLAIRGGGSGHRRHGSTPFADRGDAATVRSKSLRTEAPGGARTECGLQRVRAEAGPAAAQPFCSMLHRRNVLACQLSSSRLDARVRAEAQVMMLRQTAKLALRRTGRGDPSRGAISRDRRPRPHAARRPSVPEIS